MPTPFLLSRVWLRFDTPDEDIHGELSAAAVTPDGHIWVGSDELISVERLSPLEHGVYGEYQSFPLKQFIELFNTDGEIDIEGMDYNNGYLWLTGSHSMKRKKPKDKPAEKALERLATVGPELNRYILARLPIANGQPAPTAPHPDEPHRMLHAGSLQKSGERNILIDALQDDAHLGPFLSFALPNKENGFDIEGLAVHGDRVFLGLRGPVLRGWAIILEIEVEEHEPGTLTLKPIGPDGARYRKHFVDLQGLGIRELCMHHNDLLILAGPTMDLEGAMQLYRLHNVLELAENSISDADSDDLALLFNLPFTIGSDHAEGMALFPLLGQQDAVLVVYDSPDPARRLSEHDVFADVFLLPE
jgi:hypothetical protein